MKCQPIRDLLLVYLDGETSPEETRRVQQHLPGCQGCRAELGQLAQMRRILEKTLPALVSESSPPATDWQAIQRRKPTHEEMMKSTHALRNTNGLIPAKTVWAALLSILLILGLVGFVPQVRAQAQEFLNKIILGPYTEVAQVEPGANAAAGQEALPADMWIVRTEIGNFAGNAAPGQPATVLSFASLTEAQAQIRTTILQPAELPAGYALKEVKLAPMSGSDWVFLFYAGPGPEIIIAQLPGGPQPSTAPDQVTVNKTGMLTTGSLIEVDFDGRLAAWIGDHTLMWADANTTYEVGGLGLDLEQAQAIARSLR